MSELNIPESWAESTLGLIDLLKHGQVNSTKELAPDEKCLVEMEDIEKDSGKINFDRPIPSKMSTKNRFSKGDVLYGKLRPYLNKCAVADRAGVCSSEILVLSSNFFDSKYLAFYLRSPYFKNFVSDKVHGARMPRLSREVFQSSLFPFPSRKEQERIVQKIESCLKKIDDTEISLDKVETLLEKYRESLLAKAFRGELVSQDPNDEPASVLLEKIHKERSQNAKGKKAEQEFAPIADDEKPFELPAGWEWVRLGEICSKIGSGKTPKGGDSTYVKSGIPLIRSQNVYNSKLILENVAFIKDSIHQQMQNTEVLGLDVLLNITGGSIGRSCVVPKDWKTGNVNQHVCIIRPVLEKEILAQFITLYLQSVYGQKLVRDNQKGAAREAINMEQINSFALPLPPVSEIAKIIEIIERGIQKLSLIQNDLNTKLKVIVSLREAILQKAFEGRLVEQILSEGTGHELLAKILAGKEIAPKAEPTEKSKKTIKKAPAKAVKAKGKKYGKK